MPVTKVEVFQATDGTRYDTEAEARLHDQRDDIRKWYADNGLYAERTVPFDDLVEWITSHPSTVRSILQLFR